MVIKTKEDKRRKWILSLGFSEADADSFIEFEVPNRKIEALAEVLHKPEPEPAPEEGVEPVADAESPTTEAKVEEIPELLEG